MWVTLSGPTKRHESPGRTIEYEGVSGKQSGEEGYGLAHRDGQQGRWLQQQRCRCLLVADHFLSFTEFKFNFSTISAAIAAS